MLQSTTVTVPALAESPQLHQIEWSHRCVMEVSEAYYHTQRSELQSNAKLGVDHELLLNRA